MIRRIISSVILVILFAFSSMYIYAADVDFTYSAEIANHGENQYKAVRLTPEIYNNISENMADIMLYDNKNEPVPYFINNFTESKESAHKSYEMKLVNSFVKDDWFYYDYALKKAVTEDVMATSIELTSDSTSFAKKLELLGGYDNLHWELVQEDTIYNVDGNSKMVISFDDSKKYSYYRFKLLNNLEKVSFSDVTLNYDKTLKNEEYFNETLSPEYFTEERDNKTVITLKNMKNLKLNKITLKTDSIFKRSVNFSGSMSKVLYNLEFKNIKYQELTLPLNSYINVKEEAEVIIENHDDKPIYIIGVEVEYFADELVFKDPETDSVTLKYGNNEINVPKSYDIASYKDRILSDGYDILSIKNINKTAVSSPIDKPPLDYKLIFNIVLIIIAIVLGFIIIRKLKSKSEE